MPMKIDTILRKIQSIHQFVFVMFFMLLAISIDTIAISVTAKFGNG